jgi:hypothetical protein
MLNAPFSSSPMDDRPEVAKNFRVPDGIEPISALRVWRVDSDLRLHSLNREATWVPGEWLTAHCSIKDHTAPREGCTCGVYAAKDLNQLTPVVGAPAIVGKVRLAGKIIEHDRGYRAERARIVELLPTEGKSQLTESVAGRYGVPIGDEIPALSIPDLNGILLDCVYVSHGRVPPVPKSVGSPTKEFTLLGRLYILAVSLFFIWRLGNASGNNSLVWLLCAIVIGAALGITVWLLARRRCRRRFSEQLQQDAATLADMRP